MAALSFGSAGLRRSAGRWRLRDWRLRTKLAAVLLVPLVLAGVLGVLRVTDLGRHANDLAVVARQVGFAQEVALAVHDLQAERQLVAAALATGRAVDRVAQTQAERVDAAVTMLRTVDIGAAALDPAASLAYQVALGRLAGLAAVRQNARVGDAVVSNAAAPDVVARNAVAPDAVARNAAARNAVAAYSDVIAALLDLDRRVLDGTRDSPARQADGLKALAVAKEQASRQHAVLLAAILSGVLPVDQQAELRMVQARFDVAVDEFGQAVPGSQLLRTRAIVDRQRLLDTALDRAARAAPLETAPGDWTSAAAGTVEGIRQGEITQLNELRTATVARSDQAWHQALVNGAAVAALLVLAVVTLLVVVRSLLQPLRTLRTAAFDVADRKLPEAVERLWSTDGVSAQPTVDPVPVHSREEVGQVARAFDTVHAQAVRLAAEQAVARSSLNDTFRNLSGRHQCLVERQRQLIGELRSREHDPELLSGLGRLDHLAARMCRHSDNVLVLAGGRLPPGGAGPVAVFDVLHSAVSKIEQYQRVVVRRPPAVMVAGPAVNDLVHLIAELLDNAIKAGAAHAETASVAAQGISVTLGSTRTEDGRLQVEIIDSGPGLPPDVLRSINDRLASPPVVDASVSRQMGLFVVSRLAAQHGIVVRLRRCLGQVGITAEVSVPSALVSIDTRASNDGATVVPDTTDWSETSGQLPLQVSVIDETTAADLFSPASIGIVMEQRSCPRTAEQDWFELLGSDAGTPEREQDSDLLGGGTVVSGSPAAPVVAAGAAGASPLPLGRARVAGQPPEVREEIFEMVSAWFREQQSADLGDTTEIPVVRTGSAGRANAHEWRTPLDEEWQAAQALRTPVDHGVTQAGLPKRQPLARLVPGVDAIARPIPAPMPAGPPRTPDEVRGRLSRYQHGLRVGRHARIGPDEQPIV